MTRFGFHLNMYVNTIEYRTFSECQSVGNLSDSRLILHGPDTDVADPDSQRPRNFSADMHLMPTERIRFLYTALDYIPVLLFLKALTFLKI